MSLITNCFSCYPSGPSHINQSNVNSSKKFNSNNKLEYKKLKHIIESHIYSIASNNETYLQKIQQLISLIDNHISELKSYRTQILICALHELLCTSFITEHQLYELTNIIFKNQKNNQNLKTIDLEENLLNEQPNENIYSDEIIVSLKNFLNENNPCMGFIAPKLSPTIFIVLGIIAFFAAYNGFTGGAEACTLFKGNLFEPDNEKKIDSIDYIIGFISQAMVWWAFMSASVDPPQFTSQNSIKKNTLVALSCLHAIGQSIPSAIYTSQNENNTKLVYFPFPFLVDDSNKNNISGKIIVFSNFALNTYFGLSQAQGIKNFYHYLVVRFNNTVTNIETTELLYELIAAFLKTTLLVFIFVQPICDVTQFLNPTLEWFGNLLLAIYLNVGEIKFYIAANMFWGIERYIKIAYKHGPTTALKLFFKQNITVSSAIPTLLATIGSLSNMGNTRTTLLDVFDLKDERNKNLLTALIVSQFVPGYIGNRATFG